MSKKRIKELEEHIERCQNIISANNIAYDKIKAENDKLYEQLKLKSITDSVVWNGGKYKLRNRQGSLAILTSKNALVLQIEATGRIDYRPEKLTEREP